MMCMTWSPGNKLQLKVVFPSFVSTITFSTSFQLLLKERSKKYSCKFKGNTIEGMPGNDTMSKVRQNNNAMISWGVRNP